MPKVSVLTPAYNAERYIWESIDSILSQTFGDFEYIIVDDGSTDKTWEIICAYAERDVRIIPYQNQSNLWISATRNRLISLSTTDYIVWQDADDISMDYRIEKLYNYMLEHPEVGICWGGLQFFDVSGVWWKRLFKTEDIELRKTIFKYSPISQGSSIYLKKAILEAWCYDLSLNVAEDLNLSFKIWKSYKFANIAEVTLRYRQYKNSTTYTWLREMELATLKIRWNNHKSWYYHMTLIDKLYNILQLVSIYIMPTRWKIALFNLIRNQ